MADDHTTSPEEHVDFVSLRGIARLTAMDARQAKSAAMKPKEQSND